VKHNLILAALAAVSFSLPAFGQDSQSQSEYQYQTSAGRIDVTAALGYQQMEAKGPNASKVEQKGLSQMVRGEYGINDMFSAGLIVRNFDLKSEYSANLNQPSTKESGLADPVIFFHGRMAQGPGSLRFGADVGFSLEDSEISSTDNENMASGGISVAPFVGYEMIKDQCTYGARVSYLFYATERNETDKTSTPPDKNKLKGGAALTTALFYEHNMNPWILGAALEFVFQDGEKTTTAGVTTEEDASHSAYRLNVYAPYDISQTIRLLPRITYGNYMAMDKTERTSQNDMTVEIGARFTF